MKYLIYVVLAVMVQSILSSAYVPLYRLYKPATGDHFYTTSAEEANNAALNLGYNRETSPGSVSSSASDCQSLTPVYRLYKSGGGKDDHFYTTNLGEASNAGKNLGYKFEGIAYYCATGAGQCGASLPLYRFWRGSDHFYTTDLNEGFQNVIAVGGTYEGITCYIWAG